MTNAAILFEPESYVLASPTLMGRQAAGNGFLRAAVAGRGQQAMVVYAPQRAAAEVFGQLVHQLDAGAPVHWLAADRLDKLAEIGTLYLPGPALDVAARLRLRCGAGAYSLVGVTHTTASHQAMDAIVGMLAAPVMPWDALICTSNAVLSTVQVLLQAELEHLRWRFGADLKLTLPQLPVIPLGVHCADFEFSAAERAAARASLGIGDDEVLALYVGRLSFHAKAHPHAMYAGLQQVAARSGKSIALMQCGWFSNPAIEDSFHDGAAQFCPDVRALYSDGRDAAVRRRCWAAADIFISLSDNIQETFGLTPIEAMAAGIPVLVADWDGYKDTVREGIDGFRIASWMAPPGLGASLALAHEAQVDSYDYYCGLSCQSVALDSQMLVQRLDSLVGDAALRRRMGAAGKARARQIYDWSVVYGQYQDLWADLGERRRAGAADAEQRAMLQRAPRCDPARLDPFHAFAHYPSALLGPDTQVTLLAHATLGAYETLAGHSLFNYANRILPGIALVQRLFAALAGGTHSARALAALLEADLAAMLLALSVLAKMGLVHFHR